MATPAELRRLVVKIDRTVSDHAGEKAAEKAVKSFILAVPLKRGQGPTKKEMIEALVRERGEGDRKYVEEAVQSGRPGVFVRADDATRYGQFEGDSILIHGGRFGGTENLGEIVYLRPTDIVLKDAVAIDGNMEEFDPKTAAEAIIGSYAFGEEGGKGRQPWYPSRSERRY